MQEDDSQTQAWIKQVFDIHIFYRMFIHFLNTVEVHNGNKSFSYLYDTLKPLFLLLCKDDMNGDLDTHFVTLWLLHSAAILLTVSPSLNEHFHHSATPN